MNRRFGSSTRPVRTASAGSGSPGGRGTRDIVDAEHATGGHPAPEDVLEWLRGVWPDPWRGHGDFPQDAFIYEELQQRIIRSK